MDEEKLAAVVERALRNWIGTTHGEVCIARRWRKSMAEIVRRDAEYEDALQAYRQVVGKEPTSG